MMNILIEPLPYSLHGAAINADFRVMVQIEHLLQDSEMPCLLALETALRLFYKEPPENPQQAIQDMLWFYQGGEEAEETETEAIRERLRGGGADRAYDFYEDSAMIYAAFYAQYRLDLTEIEFLHWWKFRALFANIDEMQMMNKVMEYRTVDTRGMDKKLKSNYERLKKRYKLKNCKIQHRLTLAERNQAMKDYVAKNCG